jgi:hypothetical protein
VWIANIPRQVIERHIIQGLEDIFSPIKVSSLTDAEVEAIASEPVPAKRQREFLVDRMAKLQAGHNIFKSVMGSSVS